MKTNLLSQPLKQLTLLLALPFILLGCSSTTVKTTQYIPLENGATSAEHLLLDVGIVVFDPGITELKDDDLTFAEIRQAESRYFPQQINSAMQRSGNWGAVRVIPSKAINVDVIVTGKILQSDGETLKLSISARDATEQTWFTKTYEHQASRYAYRLEIHRKIDPFQNLYNEIANDLLQYQQNMSERRLAHLRAITNMRFAKSFSPEAFDQYLMKNRQGQWKVSRLPADSDPLLMRVQQIRQRDYLYIDTLQDYYTRFTDDMNKPYTQWRKETYSEAVELRKLRTQARNRTIAGVAAVLGGVLAQGSSNAAVRSAGQVGIVGGGYALKSGFEKSAEAKLHAAALLELGESLSAEIDPKVIELDDRTITLSGTVEQQYDQWREILKEMYLKESQY
ncbi:MAG: hypothetical protein K6L73_02825 [Cellvibrionaceae bacterium]